MNCSLFGPDDVFGPVVSGCRGDFDFTLLFEQSILTLVPSTILLIAAPIKMLRLYGVNGKIRSTQLNQFNLATAGIFVLLQLILLVLWAVDVPIQTRVSIPTAIIGLIVSILIVFLLLIEYPRSVRPSTLLTVYLLFTVIFDIAQARTLYLRSNFAIASVFSAALATKLVLLLLEARSKRKFLKSPYDLLPEESTCGFISQMCFWWLNPLFVKSYRNILSFNDLPAIDIDLDSKRLGTLFQTTWEKRVRPESRFTLVFISNRALLSSLLHVMFPRIIMIGFTFAQPFLITRVLNLLQEPSSSLAESQSYGLIGATAIIYLGIAISTVHYQHALNRYMTMFRGGMISLIFKKTLSARCDEYDESTALTLMSTDIDRIVQCFDYFHSAWASLIEVAIGTTLLALQMGWPCIMPLIVVGLSLGGNTAVASMIGDRQKIWVEAIQRRVAITSTMLESMKSIKMMGLVDNISNTIQDQRVRETRLQSSYRWMSVWFNIIAEIPGILAPVATFSTFAIQAYIEGSPSLNITQVFTSLSIITLTTTPAAGLLTAIPGTASCLSCFDRVQKYLIADIRHDKRVVLSSGIHTFQDITESSRGIELASIARRKDSLAAPVPAILVEGVSLKPSSNANIVLRDVSFRVDKGTILMVVGPVGVGKTTLLKALLGEIVCTHGTIAVSASYTAYCAQSPWLSNCTIQQNICGPIDNLKAIDEEWYHAVVHACALDIDFGLLPNGDRLIIGSKGVTLSGGQKQRVALARALYARQELYILDDVFSALDGHTARLVFGKIFGPHGLLRELRSTVVLVTHTTHYFSSGDQVLVLGSDGRIAQSGPYSKLRMQDGFIRDLFTNSVSPSKESASENPLAVSVSKSIIEDTVAKNKEQDASRRSGDIAVYSYYIKSVGWPKAGLFIGLCALAAFGSCFSQVWLNWWVESGGGNISKNILVYAFLAGMQIFCQGASYWAILVVIAPSTARKLHYKLLKTVTRAPQSFFDKTDTGTTLTRFSQDMTIVETGLALGVLFTVFNAFLALSQAGLIASGSYYMAATIPFLILAIFFLQLIYLRTSRQLLLLDLEARSPIYSHFLETLSGLATIRSFGWERKYEEINVKRVDHSQRPYYLLYCVQRWLTLVLSLIIGALAVLVVTLALNLKQSASAGLLGISLNNILAFSTSLQPLITGWTLLETSLGAVARVRNLELETEDENKPSETAVPPRDWPEKGEIVIRNLSIGYNLTPVVHNISLTIYAGQKVGICGRTGSGKSTLLSAVLRLIDPLSGDIFIDGLSLSSIPRNIIRSRLLVIPQDRLLLTGSLRLNVDPTCAFTDAAIVSALESVQLWPNPLATRSSEDVDFATALDAPLHTHPLSAGQAQLLSLARALLRKDISKIVLLDEATSSVDTTTDAIIQEVLARELSGHTIISVAHRLATIMDADAVVVLEQGRVVEMGKPRDLLNGTTGVGAFRGLVKSEEIMTVM